MQINNYIFDLDGTIINSSNEVLICFEKAFAQANYQIDKTRLTPNVIGPPLKEIIKLIAPKIDEHTIEIVMENFRQIYDYDEQDVSEYYSGILEFLLQAKNAGKRLFIATYKPEKPTRRIEKQFKMDMFEEIYTIDKFGEHITKIQMINDILSKYNLKKEETVMIGDAPSDVISAKESGITGIGVLWGYGDNKTDLIKSSDYTVKNVQELKECLNFNYQMI